jgi:hypothetical protein
MHLMSERNRNFLKTRKSVEFAELSAELSDIQPNAPDQKMLMLVTCARVCEINIFTLAVMVGLVQLVRF